MSISAAARRGSALERAGRAGAAALLLGALLVPWTGGRASDHADPIDLREPDSNLTGLFCFPDGDQLIVILNVRRALTTSGPYDLAPFVFSVHFDLASELRFDDPADLARYGGTVVNPEGIRSSARIELRLDENAGLSSREVTGLSDPDSIRIWTGVRDDPFIFPRFFETNVISSVIRIPMTSFPEGQQDFLIWGTTTRAEDGTLMDHVGRSNRTQLARFDFLNTLPPERHVAAIRARLHRTDHVQSLLKGFSQLAPIAGLYQYVLQLRRYDVAPDVMLYTTRFEPGFPNGRRLTDDVAALTCAIGDCILQELSYIEGTDFPRRTTNDKPFLDEFPYLAPPWHDRPAAPPPKSLVPYAVALVGAVLGAFVLTYWLGYRRGRARGA